MEHESSLSIKGKWVGFQPGDGNRVFSMFLIVEIMNYTVLCRLKLLSIWFLVVDIELESTSFNSKHLLFDFKINV